MKGGIGLTFSVNIRYSVKVQRSYYIEYIQMFYIICIQPAEWDDIHQIFHLPYSITAFLCNSVEA